MIGLDGGTPGERSRHGIAAHAVEAAALAEGAESAADRAEERLCRRLLEQEAGAAIVDGVGEAAGLVSDRQRAEPLGVHLAQPARLETRRHQREITAGEDASGLGVLEADRYPDGFRPARLGLLQRMLEMRIAA